MRHIFYCSFSFQIVFHFRLTLNLIWFESHEYKQKKRRRLETNFLEFDCGIVVRRVFILYSVLTFYRWYVYAHTYIHTPLQQSASASKRSPRHTYTQSLPPRTPCSIAKRGENKTKPILFFSFLSFKTYVERNRYERIYTGFEGGEIF